MSSLFSITATVWIELVDSRVFGAVKCCLTNSLRVKTRHSNETLQHTYLVFEIKDLSVLRDILVLDSLPL